MSRVHKNPAHSRFNIYFEQTFGEPIIYRTSFMTSADEGQTEVNSLEVFTASCTSSRATSLKPNLRKKKKAVLVNRYTSFIFCSLASASNSFKICGFDFIIRIANTFRSRLSPLAALCYYKFTNPADTEEICGSEKENFVIKKIVETSLELRGE